ncbi:MAG: HAD-IIB family hydrolase [Thermodesulfobacteriota bacterium]
MIFTDLDGSLLNHEDYSYAEAAPSLDRIRRSGIPLIVTTSKTRREVEPLLRELGLKEPIIVENGGGIFFPRGYGNLIIEKGEAKEGYTVIVMGETYSRVRECIEKIRVRFGVRGFGDMTPAEIAGLTGLPLEKAVLARQREYTEPFVMEQPDEIGLLCDVAREEGLNVTRGGRFYHLMGMGQGKGKAVRLVCEIFRRNTAEEWISIGLGDSENDLEMFEQVDIPVLIPRPEKGHLDIDMAGMVRAGETGARGWNDAVMRLLDRYG